MLQSLVEKESGLDEGVELLAGKGYRVLGLVVKTTGKARMTGLIALYDPPRKDSKRLIARIAELAVRVVMVTGDSLETARKIAEEVGLGKKICSASLKKKNGAEKFSGCDVVAGVLPKDKFNLVKHFQQLGHVVGMTGDGVNDAPALKQAEVGIAVSNATDVAKAAASIILTRPGLGGIVQTIITGRRIYQRMLTYTYNKIVKTIQISLFLGIGLLVTGQFVVTPLLVVLLLFANDFVTMSLSTDLVAVSETPEHWNVKDLIISAVPLALAWLGFAFGIYFVGKNAFMLELAQLQTLDFAALVFSGIANVYLVRNRKHIWSSRPGFALFISSLLDVLIVFLMITTGVLVTRIPVIVAVFLFASVIAFVLVLDVIRTGWRRFKKQSD